MKKILLVFVMLFTVLSLSSCSYVELVKKITNIDAFLEMDFSDIFGFIFSDEYPTVPAPEEETPVATQTHEHTYSSEWKGNDSYHWREANCGHYYETTDFGTHEWNDGVVIKEATSFDEGEIMYTCLVCNYQKIEKTPIVNPSVPDSVEGYFLVYDDLTQTLYEYSGDYYINIFEVCQLSDYSIFDIYDTYGLIYDDEKNGRLGETYLIELLEEVNDDGYILVTEENQHKVNIVLYQYLAAFGVENQLDTYYIAFMYGYND